MSCTLVVGDVKLEKKCGFYSPKYGNYYCKDHAKPINTFYWQSAEFFNVKAGIRYSYQHAMKG
jgi:hypothetical protein